MIVVVGNSASLLGHGLEPIIDAADEIVRCNAYRIDGYQDDVGSRITHWAFGVCPALVTIIRKDGPPPGLPVESWPVGIGGKPATRSDDWRELLLLVPLGRVVDLTYASLAPDVAADLHQYRLCSRHRQPSTGMFAVARAVGLSPLEAVGACGLGPANGHYYAPQSGPLSPRHLASQEQALLDRWESHGRVIQLDR